MGGLAGDGSLYADSYGVFFCGRQRGFKTLATAVALLHFGKLLVAFELHYDSYCSLVRGLEVYKGSACGFFFFQDAP